MEIKAKIKQLITALLNNIQEKRKVILALSCVVVFVTTYVLILPAFTLDKEEAAEQGGVDVPGVEQVVDTEEATEEPAENEFAKTSSEDVDKEASAKTSAEDFEKEESAKSASEDSAKDAQTEAAKTDVEEKSADVTLENKESDDFSVAVESKDAVLSEDMSVAVREIDQSSKKLKKEYESLYNDALEAVQKAQEEEGLEKPSDFAFAKFYDISLMDGNNVVEPDSTVDVKISFSEELQKELKVAVPEKVHIVHFAVDKETGEMTPEVLDTDATDITVENNRITEAAFTAESFSVFAVVYTVDFHYEVDGKNYEFTLPGGGYVSLESLIEVLNIATSAADKETDSSEVETGSLILDSVDITDETRWFVDDIENVEFSNPELVWIGKINRDSTVGVIKEDNKLNVQYSSDLTDEQIDEINSQSVKADDWVLVSLKPFTSEETLTVTMKSGEVFTIKVTDSASTNPQNTKISRDQMNVDNREEGIIIKLFDYSGTVNGNTNIDAVWGNSTNSNALRQGSGVNNGRTLVFSGSGLENQEWYNNFTGTRPNGMEFYSGFRAKGIVKDELVNGYPQLNDNINKYGSDDGNLDYLFKAGEQNGVTEYSANGQGLQGLLRKDSQGYYYYSSEDNYARYDNNGYIDLYTDTYYKQNGAQAAANNGYGSIGFFPFTDYSPSHNKEKGPNDLYYNHQLGMSMQAAFTYPPDGKLDDGTPMTFEFSGDDDVWVYVDGKLALDLGGVHQPIKGVIDFANKEVRYYEYDAYNSTNSPKKEEVTTVPFSDIFGENGFDDSSYSAHKIDFFFLERGGCDSNCELTFNLQTLATAEKQFMKVDDNGVGLAGAEFTVFTDEACTEPLSVNNEAFTATSDENGKVSFSGIPVRKDSDRIPIVYYMKETTTPVGFISNDTIYKLVYNSSTKSYDVLTLEGESSETIVNEPIRPIELGVEKQWQDAEGNPITPGNNYSATFELHRLRSYQTPDEIVIGTEETLRIRHLDNDNTWNTSGEQVYKYLRGRTVTVNYDYHGTSSNNNRQYRYRTSDNSNWSYSARNIPEKGSFNITIPNNGRYTVEFYDQSNAVTWTIDDGAAEGETVVDEPDSGFSKTLTLENGVFSGKFDSGMYAGTADAGKFPLQEENDGVVYSYKYYITETARTPNNYESVFVDSDGKVISDPSTNYLESDTTQLVKNRELLDIPFEKYWDFDPDATSDAYSWSATLQLLSRFVDKNTGESVTSFEPVDGKQLTVTSNNNGQGTFNDLPMFGAKDGVEYRIQYSVAEIGYSVKRTSDDEVVAQWQDPNYFDHPIETIGEEKYTLHYIQDAGENGSTVDDYSIIVNNTPENRVETKAINISLQKTWPEDVELSDAFADFKLKRYVYEEYRNFPESTTDWVEITLDTGAEKSQTLRVPKDWEMTIFGNIKSNTNALSIEFSDGSTPSGVPVFSYDNSSKNSEHTFAITFTADSTKTVTLVNGAQYVAGGIDGFRLTDINDPNDMEVKLDKGFELPIHLSDENNWQASMHHLPAIEEDTQYDVENPLEITRYVYRYFIEETACSPEDYIATFQDSNGNLFGDEGNRIDNDTVVTAANNLKPGSLKITKNVTVNNDDPSSTEASLVDGDYTFTIVGLEGTDTEGESRTVTVTISGGQSKTVEVEGLKPGQYKVTEQTPENGTSLVGDNDITLTITAGKTGSDVEENAIGEFTNNINTTNIEFAKAWVDEDKTTPLAGQENTIVTYTLMQIATKKSDGSPVHDDVFEGEYFLNNIKRTATANNPCIIYVSQNEPVTVSYLPTEGVIDNEPVTYSYYAVEQTLDGFVPDAQPAIDEGTYTITNAAVPQISQTTDVTVEKEWSGTNADSLGGAKFVLVQERAEIPSNSFYPFIIHLRDSDGEIRNDKLVYVSYRANLNIHVDNVDDSILNGLVRQDSSIFDVIFMDGDFQVNNIGSSSSTELRIVYPAFLGVLRWGSNEAWNLGDVTATRGEISDTPKTFIDNLNSGNSPLEYSETGVSYTVNMPKAGESEVVGNAYTTTQKGDWGTTVNGLQYYELGEDGKYYTYRYKVKEISIIDSDTKEEIETVTQNNDGTGGESTHFIVEYDNTAAGDEEHPLTITNTRKPYTEITLKKVDQADLNKSDLTEADLLDGAKFRITKYKKLAPLEEDSGWNSAHSVESAGTNGVFTFEGLTAGIYKIEETEYPTGYIQIEEDPFIRVNDDLSIDLIDSEGNTIEGNITDLLRVEPDSTTIIVGNVPGVELPNSGGIGTTIFYVLGTILVLSCGIYLIARRRMIS